MVWRSRHKVVHFWITLIVTIMKFISKARSARLWAASFLVALSIFALSTISSAVPISVGDQYGGGIVFYILQPGDSGYDAVTQHGLIAATEDINVKGCVGKPGMYFWSVGKKTTERKADSYVQIFTTSQAIGQGAENTKKILAKCPAATHPTIAAAVASAYNGGGNNDWYLPSKDELNKLYLTKAVVGGFAEYDYWSSTENSATTAWVQLFSNGYQFADNKMDADFVRPVRSF